MYVDDLAGLIPGKMVATALPAPMEALKEFSLVSGLGLNPAKCGIVIKVDLPPDALAAIQQSGISVVSSVRYLGVKMGNIASKDAFAASMGEAQKRVNIASTLGLSQQERVQILKVWILPVLLLTESLLPRPGCCILPNRCIQYSIRVR